jgi:hypothetical protein
MQVTLFLVRFGIHLQPCFCTGLWETHCVLALLFPKRRTRGCSVFRDLQRTRWGQFYGTRLRLDGNATYRPARLFFGCFRELL